MIIDVLFTPCGLRDVLDIVRELTMVLIKEPADGGDNDCYWRDLARALLGWCILLEIMIEGYDAQLSKISLLLQDRQRLEDNLRFVLGVDLNGKALSEGPMPLDSAAWAQHHAPEELQEFAATFRATASNNLAFMQNNAKNFESTITQAQNALSAFAFGRLSTAMGRSTFKMSDLKNETQATSLFIVVDASKPETSETYLSLIQWGFLTEMKRHKSKHVPVYNILDEVTNYRVHGLIELLTWGRGHGIRNHLIFQDFTAFEKKYGKGSLETLLSETEIKQFLPGQRSPKTLSMIVKMLGEQSVMAGTYSKHEPDRALGESMSEVARPLMTEDEVRRMDRGLLFVRKAPPALIDLVSYAEIAPWRKQVGINPFHGKPFLKPVKLKLKT